MSVTFSITQIKKWETDDQRSISPNSHTHLLTFASVDSCSDVRFSQKVGDSHGVGGSVVTDAETGDICCHWRAGERLYWCQWIDFIPPRCQKPPAPFSLLSPAADHSEAACVRPQHWGTLRKIGYGWLSWRYESNGEFGIKTAKVDQTDALIHFRWENAERRPQPCLKLVSSHCKQPVTTAPWIHPSPLTVASKPLEKWQKFLSVAK